MTLRHPFLVPGSLAAGFMGLMGIAKFDPDDFARADALGTAFVRGIQAEPWVDPFIALTALGSASGIFLLALLIAWVIRRHPALLARFAIALIGASVTVAAVKELIRRARPAALSWLGPLHSYSFPSGHATSAMALFGFVVVLAWHRSARPFVRGGVLIVSALLVLGIGASRIVLDAHYLSDVIAGYVLGAAWVAFAFALPLPRRAVH